MEWINIKDRLPEKNNEAYLVRCPKYCEEEYLVALFGDGQFEDPVTPGNITEYVTHWGYLEPPKN